MWLSKQMKQEKLTARAELGVTSIGGGQVGVFTRGEVRSLPVFGPGGYVWQPRNGDQVLVLKGGPGGEEGCVAATSQIQPPPEMQPGEVYLSAGNGTAIYLKCDGSVELQGKIQLSGSVDVTGSLSVNGRPVRTNP